MPMQTTTIRFGDIDIAVEAQTVVGSQTTSKTGRAGEQVLDSFDLVRETVVAVAAATVGSIRSAAASTGHPDEIEVEFGLKFTVTGNVIVAGAAGEANLVIRLKWVHDSE